MIKAFLKSGSGERRRRGKREEGREKRRQKVGKQEERVNYPYSMSTQLRS